MDLHPDFRDLLAELVHEGVSYVVLGGYAVGHHAKPRATKDLDLLVAGGDNLARVASALKRFGAPSSVVEAARHLAENEIVYLGVEPVRVDILRSAAGIETDRVLERAEHVVVGGLNIAVIGLDDLIANKKAAGRRQDLADVELLERVRARRR